jgi:hypothetical protein
VRELLERKKNGSDEKNMMVPISDEALKRIDVLN